MEKEISKPKVAVLTGGISTERDISLQSGQFVAEALKEAGLEAVFADISPENLDILEDGSIDVFFPALHGRFGEDGELQQVLEDKGLVYTGSGPEAGRLAIHKMTSKRLFSQAGVATAPAVEFRSNFDRKELGEKMRELGGKYVVKPITHGSSVGVSIVHGTEQAVVAARECERKFANCMIEKFIAGREVTVGILGDQALPIIEIRPKDGFYDYHAKYIDERTEHLFDTIEDPGLIAKIQTAALNCFSALGCRHFARVDLILSETQIPYALEVNVIPGLTAHSNVPMAANKAGLSNSELCTQIIEMALKDKSKLAYIR